MCCVAKSTCDSSNKGVLAKVGGRVDFCVMDWAVRKSRMQLTSVTCRGSTRGSAEGYLTCYQVMCFAPGATEKSCAFRCGV